MSLQQVHLKVGFLQDLGKLSCAVVMLGQDADFRQNLAHQLHVVVPHCLQLHILQSLMSLGKETDQSLQVEFSMAFSL